MSVNAGTAQLVFTVLSLVEMPQLGHVTQVITAHLVLLAHRKSPATQEHTVLDRMNSQHCVPLEHTSQATLEQISMSV